MRHTIKTALFFAILPITFFGCAGAATSGGEDNPSAAPVTVAQSTAELGFGLGLTPVPNAQPKAAGLSSPNVLSPELLETVVAQGSIPVENPTAESSSVSVSYYGYFSDGPLVPAFGSAVEATKSEPDKNTYLVLNDQTGPDADYDYGRHFLFQGHEGAVTDDAGNDAGYITRVNLDADYAHQVTVWATKDSTGKSLPFFDGSTYDPWAQRLIFTSEGEDTYTSTLSFPPTVDDVSGSIGRGGFEGVQNDSAGNVWLVEDSGGAFGASQGPHAKQPNSFLYRFIPKNPKDLMQGKLQVLQVASLATGTPIVFHPGQADADIFSADTQALHTYGNKFDTTWITIHDTDVDGTAFFDINPLAKAKGGTPFKRPENAQFRPGFREYYFSVTGDTDARTEAGTTFGGFGAIFKLTQSSPTADQGKLTLFYLSDEAHSGFDNCAFWTKDHVVFVEDAGDTLHTQRNALDSAYAFDVRLDYSNPKNVPVRIIAEGRDPAATIDSGLAGQPGFQNEGDNEITGIHVSNGDASKNGVLGAQAPNLFDGGWRAFYTAQHGNNATFEILPKSRRDH